METAVVLQNEKNIKAGSNEDVTNHLLKTGIV